MNDLKLIVSQYENDNVMKILLPMVEKRFKEALPDVVIEVTTGQEEKRPTFTGVKQGLTLFKLEGIYAPSDILSKFKSSLR